MARSLSDTVNRSLTLLTLFPWLLKRVKGQLPAIVFMMFCGAFVSVLGVVFALQTQSVIDAAVARDPFLMTRCALWLLAIIVGIVCLNLTKQYFSEKLVADLDKNLKSEYFSLLLGGDYAELTSYHSGNLVNRLTSDVNSICNGLTSSLQSTVSLLAGLTATIIALSQYSFLIMGVLLLASVILGLGLRFVAHKIVAINMAASRANGKILGFFQEVIGRLLVVKALEIEPVMESRGEGLLNERRSILYKRIRLNVFFSGAISGLTYIMEFFALVLCSVMLIAGTITFGGLVAVTQLAAKLEAPFYVFPALAKQLISMLASAERLRELELITPDGGTEDESDAEGPIEAVKEDASVSLDPASIYSNMQAIVGRDLNFAYERIRRDEADAEEGGAVSEESKTVLEDVSLRINKGCLTVICGESGIGKSTILKLMMAIYKPQSGDLYVECTDGSKVPLTRKTRGLFTYAPQGNLLISGTIRENIMFVRPDATEEELQQAIYVSDMQGFLDRMPEGLDTMLGENSSGVSEGQAQRISLARAVLHGAPILLLDEITSSLDPETEQTVVSRICELGDRTCVVVTHRESLRKVADQVIHIDRNAEGKLVVGCEYGCI